MNEQPTRSLEKDMSIFAATAAQVSSFSLILGLVADLQNLPYNGIRQPNFYIRVFFSMIPPILGPNVSISRCLVMVMRPYEQLMFDCIHIPVPVADRSHSIGVARCW